MSPIPALTTESVTPSPGYSAPPMISLPTPTSLSPHRIPVSLPLVIESTYSSPLSALAIHPILVSKA
jgi:hypothetical protein